MDQASGGKSMTAPTDYRDQTALAKWCRWLLFAQAALALISALSGFVTAGLLADVAKGMADPAAVEQDDMRTGVIALLTLLLLIINLIAIGTWIVRASRNAWILRPDEMEITPGWAVGWYFVPIANLYLPFKAMQEIWLASANAAGPEQYADAGGLLNSWWGFWLLSNILGAITFQIQMRADSLEAIRLGASFSIAADVLNMAASLLMAAVIARTQKMQTAVTPGEHGEG